MDYSSSKKILICYVYEILKEYSDEDHKLSQSQIVSLIHKEYGMTCDRKAVGRNINMLMDAGVDISTYEDNNQGYYLNERIFTDSEIKMLIDTVLASRYIPNNHAKELIHKLSGLSNHYFKERTPYISQSERWIHTDNQNVFYNIEILDEAIEEHLKVSFTYNQYAIDLKMHPRHGYSYEVDPYQITCSNGRYYLVGNYDKHDCVTNFRIDLITDVKKLEIPATPFENLPNRKSAFNISDYEKYALNMYDGKKISAVIRLRPERIGDVIDWFGKDITILSKEEDGYIRVRVTASDNGLRIWAIQYGRIVEILSPLDLRENIKKDIMDMAEKYKYI